MKTNDYIALEDQYGAHNYHPLDVVINKGEGVWVYDVDGNQYMDCLSAYSAVNQGHCHPKIMAAFEDQVRRVTLTSRAFRNDKLPLFCEKLAKLSGMDMVLPMNSGAEAVETAVVARQLGYRQAGRIVTEQGIEFFALDFQVKIAVTRRIIILVCSVPV